jgi:hypothetical protein
MAKYLVKFTLNGTPKTALTPTVDTYIKLSDSTDVAQVPTIAEAKNGFYIMTATPTELMGVRIDGGAGVTNAAERYKFLQIGPNDYFADAAITSRASATDYTAQRAGNLDRLDANVSSRGTGDATAASQTTIINGLDAIASAIGVIAAAIGGIPAAVWTYLSNQGNRVVSNLITFFQNAGVVTANRVDNVTVIQEQQAGSRIITITVVNSNGDPVPDVEIQTYTPGGSPAGTRGRTNASGQMSTSIDDGAYIIQAHKSFFDVEPLSITVDATHTAFEIAGTEWTRDAAAIGYQTIYGDAQTLGPVAAAGDIISIRPARNSMMIGGSIINPVLQKATVTDQGTFQIQVRKGAAIILEASTGDLTYYTQKITEVTQDNEKALSSYPKG